jgi:hypothetical protein
MLVKIDCFDSELLFICGVCEKNIIIKYLFTFIVLILQIEMTQCEIENRKELFCELPGDEFLDQTQTIVTHHKRLTYNFCAWCGKKEHLFNFKKTTGYRGITLFCKHGDCFEKYGMSLGSYSADADLTNGVPFILQYVKTSDNIHCRVPKREFDSKGRLIDLICMYCGIQSSNVISHPLVLKRYAATSFCKNKICYASFTEYVDKIAPARIPYAFSINYNGELTYTAEVKNQYATHDLDNKKKKTKHSPHSHSLTLKLPIVLSRDEFVHKDVGMWCPKSDEAIDSFRNVLLGAFCDFAQDCNSVELLKAVKCVK